MLLLLLGCAPSPDTSEPVSRPRVARPAARARHGRTLSVDCQGNAPYPDILTALADATSGDTIEVAPCTYYGSIDFGGKAVRIVGTGGAAVTTVRGVPGEPVVEARNGESGAVVEGLTLTGGGGADEPAVRDDFSALTLRDVVVTGNVGTVTVYARSGHMVLERVTIEGNTPSEGMLIQARRGAIVVKDSTVRCGETPYGYRAEHGAGFVDGGTFDCPGQTAIEFYHCPGRAQRVTVDGLVYGDMESTSSEPIVVEGSVLLGGATISGGDMRLRNVVSKGTVTATSALLTVESSVLTGAACGIAATGSTVTARYVDFWQNTQDACGFTSPVGTNGSVSVDPLFTDAAAGDYTLAAGSPLTDAGPTDDGWADPDGSRNDIGAYGGPLSMGGGW